MNTGPYPAGPSSADCAVETTSSAASAGRERSASRTTASVVDTASARAERHAPGMAVARARAASPGSNTTSSGIPASSAPRESACRYATSMTSRSVVSPAGVDVAVRRIRAPVSAKSIASARSLASTAADDESGDSASAALAADVPMAAVLPPTACTASPSEASAVHAAGSPGKSGRPAARTAAPKTGPGSGSIDALRTVALPSAASTVSR